MKKWLSAMLMLILLVQAMPLGAFAAAGHVLTDEELAAAYALTGFGDSSVQSNATYHKGMKPNVTWNAMQVSEWLDEQLKTYVFSVEDILTRASIKLAKLQESDPEGYSRFSDDSSEYTGVATYIREMYRTAEAMREEMRYLQDRIDEQAGIIAELGRQLKEGGDSLYPSDRVRLSAKIKTATAELKAARQEAEDRADEWELKIELMQTTLDATYGGAAADDHPAGLAGDWVEALFAYDSEPASNTVPVAVVNASGSRLGRMASKNSVLSNADSATVHVMTENEIGLVFYTSDGNGGRKYLQNVNVTVKDARNPKTEIATYTSDERGGVYIPSSKFTVNDDKNVLFRLDVEAEALGYRSFGASKVEMKLGEVRQMPMTPLYGVEGNGVVSNDAGPYVYSISFEDNDIRGDDYEMINSSLNSWDFEIKVEVRNPDGGSVPTPLLSYWTEGSSSWKWQQKWAEPTSHEGNVYTFRNKWKRILAPEVPKEQRPFVAFSKDASAERFSTRLISVPSVVDSPVEDGSDAFQNVFEEGLGFSFTIPGVDADVSFNLPWKKYLPKVTIDNGGFITVSIGSDLFAEKLEGSKVAWQSQDMKDLQQAQKNAEKEGGFANHLAQMGAAYDYYKTEGWKFMGESKLEVGWFVLLSGRKDVDEDASKSERGMIKARLATGILLKYSYSWTILHMLGPVPLYVSFTLGVNAGFAVSLEAGFSWTSDHGFDDWEFKPLRDITINIAFTFSAQVGAGVKGFLELYFRFSASLNFRITFVIMGAGLSSFTIGGNVGITLGVTLVFVDISKSWGPWGGTWYDSRTNANAIPPLQQYALANANAPEEIDAATQEPTAYAQLAPAAKTILTNEANAHSTIRVATSNGHTFAFYIDEVGKRQRLCWVDVNTGKKGNTQDYIDELQNSRKSDDYDFDVWSDGKTVFVVVCCADQFDENGYPAEGTMIYPHAFIYHVTMEYLDIYGEMGHYTDFYAPRELSACDLNGAVNLRGLANPHIEWAKATYGTTPDNGDKYLSSLEIYGFAERVGSGSDETGYACFKYTGGRSFVLMSDMAIQNALGEDHERVNLRSSVKGYGKSIDAPPGFRCLGFIALSRPKEGVEGESAIELYDWEMNSAPVTYTTKVVKPVVEITLTSTKRKTIAVKKGDIGGFELVQTVGAGSDDYAQTLFYAEGEADGDGAKQYKLKGLHIGNKKGANTRSLSYDVTDYSYDVTLPSAKFNVQTVHDTPYIYWLSTVEKKNESDPDTWRLWVAVYDPASNTVSTPAVFSEFTLQNGIVPRDVLLTTDGQGYLTATPLPKKDGESKPQPVTLYSFPLTLKPVLTLKGMSVENVTVAAGDFEDTSIALMNEGNMGISAFDLEMYTLDGGIVNVVETLHCDCLHPENSSLTMHSEGRSATLPEGRQAIYRNSDFNYTPRQRDWVLGEKKLTLKASQRGKNDAWTSSLSERGSKTNFVQTNMLMPGALASFTGSLKIPENWSGDKTLYLRVSKASSNANWQGAMANAAGVKGDTGIAPNAAATTELTWVLDEKSGLLVLQADELASNAAFANAVASGLIANAVKATDPVALNVSIHDIEVDHRIYEDCDGTELVDIVVSNFANTDDSFKLSCQVYLDGSEDYRVVGLPIHDKSVARRTTHTITVPVALLVDDPAAHNSARVVISAIGRDETAYANNEFTLFLGGGDPLHFEVQPRDVTAQEGEDVSFSVEVAGGKQPYTYQWQVWDPKHEKWVDLPGFTGPTLSRKDIEKKWDGARFRCIVTDAEGTQIISQEATLTIRDGVDTGDHSNLSLYLAVAIAALIMLWWMRRRSA